MGCGFSDFERLSSLELAGLASGAPPIMLLSFALERDLTGREMTKNLSENDVRPDDIADQASRNTLALNPFVGMRNEDLTNGARVLLSALTKEPAAAAKQWFSFLGELGNIATGNSARGPDAVDKRFNDAAWQTSKLHKGLLQTYLAWGDAVKSFVDQTSLVAQEKARAQLFASIFVDALAPTNGLLTNPAALRHLIDTGGESLLRGWTNYLDDLVNNGGMPSQVDKSPFKVGENLAITPGAVVFRNDLIELIQYEPMTPTVRKRPIIITPPQINKYYSLDLTPEKSVIRFLLESGFQPFAISWRNPSPEHRDWGLDTYVAALDEAVDATLEITGSPDASMFGACSGGITSSAYLAMLAGRKQDKIRNIVLAVCVLDMESVGDTQLASLTTPKTLQAAKEASKARGVLDGTELAKMFAWMRPNDLVWNYWVNNYLLGKTPPAFDILFWNADTTCLPARLHHDYVDFNETNPFVNGGKLALGGTAIDMKKVRADSYVIAGTTDHITPWKAVYQTARIYGDDTTFVLSNSGHLQALINPPTNPKASFMTGPASAPSPDAFAATAEKRSGSWWLHWADWLHQRSGEEVPAPGQVGSARHPAKEPAPGTYVFD